MKNSITAKRPDGPAISARTKGRCYAIRNATADEAELLIYQDIGFWGMDSAQFARDLATITAATINVRINSNGGDVFAGIAIYNSLINHGARIVVYVDGIAASIASVIAMAGDE